MALCLAFMTSAPAAQAQDTSKDARILAIGDSMLAWHGVTGRAVPDVIEKQLGEPVQSRAFGGARIRYQLPLSGQLGFSIPKQFKKGDWDWVVMNGGGNDLWLGCGCHACDRRINKMISNTGSNGDIPKLVSRIRNTGAKVLYIGYLRSPGVDAGIDDCRELGDELERRLALMADQNDHIHFLSIADLVPYGDTSFHGVDMIHPSIKGSAAIAKRAVEIIQSVDPDR